MNWWNAGIVDVALQPFCNHCNLQYFKAPSYPSEPLSSFVRRPLTIGETTGLVGLAHGSMSLEEQLAGSLQGAFKHSIRCGYYGGSVLRDCSDTGWPFQNPGLKAFELEEVLGND
jgi:hypothetical protein